MFKDWKRGVFHDILMNTLEPLRRVMEDGINLMCPDGQRRLCFPVLAQYIADYEEQRVLASILNGYCPKCMIPRYHKPRGEVDLHSDVQEENGCAFGFPGSLPKTKWTGR